jgi:hypothetical protein
LDIAQLVLVAMCVWEGVLGAKTKSLEQSVKSRFLSFAFLLERAPPHFLPV